MPPSLSPLSLDPYSPVSNSGHLSRAQQAGSTNEAGVALTSVQPHPTLMRTYAQAVRQLGRTRRADGRVRSFIRRPARSCKSSRFWPTPINSLARSLAPSFFFSLHRSLSDRRSFLAHSGEEGVSIPRKDKSPMPFPPSFLDLLNGSSAVAENISSRLFCKGAINDKKPNSRC